MNNREEDIQFVISTERRLQQLWSEFGELLLEQYQKIIKEWEEQLKNPVDSFDAEKQMIEYLAKKKALTDFFKVLQKMPQYD